MTMRSVARHLGLFSLVVVAAVFTAAGARANPAFPTLLQQNVPMPCLPPCTICHLTNAGGPGMIRPMSMGTTWPMYGLDGTQPASLVPALTNARGAMQDTDHDTVPDDVELNAGADPNNPAMGAMICGASGGTGTPPAGPSNYGCFRVARQGSVDGAGAVAAALVALTGLSAVRRRTASKKR
jgi:hypothetical protein